MPRSISLVALVAAYSFMFIAPVGAQERRQVGPAPYDLAREVTQKAIVVRSYTIAAPGTDEPLAVLAMTIDGKTVQGILGPPDFVAKQKVTLKPGATVEVTGLPNAHMNGEAAMIVRKVKAGKDTLTLRDEKGKELWTGTTGTMGTKGTMGTSAAIRTPSEA